MSVCRDFILIVLCLLKFLFYKEIIVTSFCYTGISHFLNLGLLHFTFMKDLQQYLFLLTERNSKRIFTFPGKNNLKVNIVFSVCFGGGVAAAAIVAVPSSFQGITLSISQSRDQSLELCCKHLCFISIYFVHPLARCIQR